MSKLAYTLAEAAAEASVELGTIVRAVQDGDLTGRDVDGDLRVTHADMVAWLGSCPVWATAPA